LPLDWRLLAGARDAARRAGAPGLSSLAGLAGAAGLADGVGEEELDLGVDGAQLVCRPLLEGGVELRRDPEEEGLALGHAYP
jgi:hypothetical protein